MLKRGVDIALSIVLLIIALPILAVAAFAIKIDSAGPVLFCQTRVGRRFGRFRILKLRTMSADAQGPHHTLDDDPRITRVGRWLRWVKVDELPQLWNVLAGDMSLVGPRPVVPELVFEFRPIYSQLLNVRPGLTDPASVKYCRENEFLAGVANQSLFFKTVFIPDKLRISAAYLRRANFWSDLCVLGETFLAVIPSHWKPYPVRTQTGSGQPAPLFLVVESPMAMKKPPVAEHMALPDAAGLEEA